MDSFYEIESQESLESEAGDRRARLETMNSYYIHTECLVLFISTITLGLVADN